MQQWKLNPAWFEKKHARSVPKNTGWSGRYKKHYLVVPVAFVAAARFLDGKRFVLPSTEMIHHSRRPALDVSRR